MRYRADNALSRGIGVVLLWVGLLLLAAITLVSFIIWLTGSGPNDEGTNFAEALWISLTRSLDPGTFSSDEGFRFRVATLFVTLFGLLVLATLIGLVSNAIDRRIEELRRGKSVVLENGHTLILGVSQKLPIVVKEIIEANSSVRKHTIVILTSQDKVLIEENLRRLIPDLGTTRIVVRSGETSSLIDLDRVSPSTAKVIVILADDNSRADSFTVRTALAVLQVRGAESKIPVIIEVTHDHTASALRQALPKNFMPIITNEIISKVAAQTSRSSGLGVVYQELLGFVGNEFYLTPVPRQLIGESFAAIASSIDSGVLVGVKQGHCKPVMAPNSETILEESDQLLVLAEDDSLIAFAPTARRPAKIHSDRKFVPEVIGESLLVLGWNPTAPWILLEIDRRVVSGSQLTVMAHPKVADLAAEFLNGGLLNQQHSLIVGDPTSFPEIYRLFESKTYDHVLVLGSMGLETAVESDASTLLTLMHIRSALDELKIPTDDAPNIAAELYEEDSVDLARIARPDDFIVSQRIVSLLLAQLSENPDLFDVFNQLLDPVGCEILMVPAVRFLDPGEHSMASISETVLANGAVVLGWQLELNLEVGLSSFSDRLVLNPPKHSLLKVSEGTLLVILSPNDSL